VTSLLKIVQTADEKTLQSFFHRQFGQWRSERRYYTLLHGKIKEIENIITIKFLAQGDDELQQLAHLHELSDLGSLICGAKVSWESTDLHNVRKEAIGMTIFGVLGNLLYRDRGFATTKPVRAQYNFPHPKTLCLRTEYNNSVFEEEIKLIGDKYRTRQNIISRAGEQLIIGQYLEKRIQAETSPLMS
jgi:hypothetical protein